MMGDIKAKVSRENENENPRHPFSSAEFESSSASTLLGSGHAGEYTRTRTFRSLCPILM